MRGEFIGVWSDMWREIWIQLFDESLENPEEFVKDDIFCDIYRELAGDPKRPRALKNTPSVEILADIIDDPLLSRKAFEATTAEDLIGEQAVVNFLESVHEILDEFGGDELTNRYFNMLTGFIDKYSLRYDLRRPCALCPTLPGVFASLVRDLRVLTSADQHLDTLMKEFEISVRNLRDNCSEGNIKTCIQKQVNLLEALGQSYPGVTRNTLGGICEEVGTWPHEKVKTAMKDLYTFASDYPGIRHGGTPGSAIPNVDMRDMVAMSILLTGFTPYLSHQLNAESVYRRA